MSKTSDNAFTHEPLGLIYVKTALPIIFVMGMSGLLSVADALFLAHYVGPDALAAVTLMFPVYMLIVALSTLVSNGMSSIVARHLGAGNIADARAAFSGAHGLAAVTGLILILVFGIFGPSISLMAAGGSPSLARMGLIYLQITVLFSPLLFILSVNSDALRNEGRVGFMAGMSLLVSLSNIAFNYLLIAVLEMGVAGSAYGTALAQALSFSIILGFRIYGQTELRPSALWQYKLHTDWRHILALGAPQSLNFIGIGLGSATIIAALQLVDTAHYEATVSAYGIITRVLTFGFLPLLGLSYAMQTITGNNFGARDLGRSNRSLKIAILAALIYCSLLQAGLTLFAQQMGAAFVGDPLLIAEVARILPVVIALFFIAGPQMMIAMHHQAIGDASSAALLSLTKPYLLAIPLTFGLAAMLGENGIWIAAPLSELLLMALTTGILAKFARRRLLRWGLFHSTSTVRT